MNPAEILGYIATALVAFSFTRDDVKQLRTINCMGACLFIIYGFWITAYPVILVNGFIASVNAFHLWKTRKQG